MKILTVIGARPQFIKAAVLSRYLRDNKCGIEEILVHTGQHYDANMSEVFFQEMDIPKPQFNLHLGSGSHGKHTDGDDIPDKIFLQLIDTPFQMQDLLLVAKQPHLPTQSQRLRHHGG